MSVETFEKRLKNNAFLVIIMFKRSDDDDDDEVRRVCKTPGDPCGCTSQYYERSGLPLPSPWIIYWSVFSSSLFFSLLIFTFSCLSLTDLSHLPRVQIHV